MASGSHHASLWLPINRLLLSDEEINLYPVQFTDSLDCLLFAAKGIPNWYTYQISSLLFSCHCAWNSPTRDASFVLSLPFMGTSTHIKVEAGGPMKFIFEPSEFGSLLPGFGLFPLPQLWFAFSLLSSNFPPADKSLRFMGYLVSINLSFPTKSLLLVTNLSL